MKNVFHATIILGLLLLVMVSGCGGSSSGAAAAASKPAETEQKESGSTWDQMHWDKGKWG